MANLLLGIALGMLLFAGAATVTGGAGAAAATGGGAAAATGGAGAATACGAGALASATLGLRGAGVLATSVCQVYEGDLLESSCDSASIAYQMVRYCNIGNVLPSRQCCNVVLAAIDAQDAGCLCLVVEEGEFTISYLTVSTIWGYYRACGGHQQRPPRDSDKCEHAPAPTPPPPPPPSPPPPRPGRSPPEPPKRSYSPAQAVGAAVGLGFGIACGIGFLVLLAVLAVKAWFKNSREVSAAIRVQEQQGISLTLSAAVRDPVPPVVSAPVDAEVSPVQRQAVARLPTPPLFAPQPVLKEGEAPRAPPFNPLMFMCSWRRQQVA